MRTGEGRRTTSLSDGLRRPWAVTIAHLKDMQTKLGGITLQSLGEGMVNADADRRGSEVAEQPG